MSEFIFQQKSQNTRFDDDSTRYCIFGSHDVLDSDGYPVVVNTNNKSPILAYKTKKPNGDFKYMVRINYEKKMYNPLSIYGQDKSFKLLDNITRSSIEYKEVNSTAFDFYLRFLSTKNTAWLNKAEREV